MADVEVYINGVKFVAKERVDICLQYDSVASTFTIPVYVDTKNAQQRALFRPFSYPTIKIMYAGVLMLTGVVVNHNFSDAGDPPKSLAWLTGFSTTGHLEDSCVLSLPGPSTGEAFLVQRGSKMFLPQGAMQFNGMKLQHIAEMICQWYGIKVVVDKELVDNDVFNRPYQAIECNPDETVAHFLNKLCAEKLVVLSHDNKGNLLLTRAKSDAILTNSTNWAKEYKGDLLDTGSIPGNKLAAYERDSFKKFGDNVVVPTSKRQVTQKKDRKILFHFKRGDGKFTDMSLVCDGQKMHRIIQVAGQQSDGGVDSSLDSAIVNPLVKYDTRRYTRYIQTTGDETTTTVTARALLAEELKGLVLTFNIRGWVVNGHVVTPNQMIEVTNDELLFKPKTKWFITQVEYRSSYNNKDATIKCMLPGCFNTEDVVSIF